MTPRCFAVSAHHGSAHTVCAAPTGAANLALYGKMPSVVYEDFAEAKSSSYGAPTRRLPAFIFCPISARRNAAAPDW